ncbi:hypothetical protein BKA66DRAFT_415082 [Pyrenochaeta sp. MPI-SDFR-AT-0127]|nr:hypothetical protein BKA66DRAFT_415082 [Pyrenochaeta sp. MPI-SDFR-AT-0127]
MPRKLPWMNKGGGSRIQAKQPPAKKQCAVSDIDDGFFDGTVLASSRKDQEPADESDNDFPDLPAEPSTPRTKSRKDALFTKRAQSSSPPPIADLEQPPIESMRMGVSKFDLRDDEWMMVEDEFLETAKLFTRHLHIAEYEKLKERIEEKKKEAKAARPVVANAKMSVEGAMKEKATVQEQKQRKAIRDVYASHDDDGVAMAKSPFNSSRRSDLSEDTADRLAKRKAEREKEEKEKERAKRKAVKSDEIPTFLF